MSVRSGLQRLGEPAGTCEADWVRAMRRNPTSISGMPGGLRLLQWRSGTYMRQSVAVLFDQAATFVKITHRYQC